MGWKAWLITGGVALLLLFGLLAGATAAYGLELSEVLDAWAAMIRSVLFWAIVASAILALAVATIVLLARRAARSRRPAPAVTGAGQPGPVVAAAPQPAAPRPPAPDHVPGPRDFIPSVSPQPSGEVEH